jgi:hypothetical protein
MSPSTLKRVDAVGRILLLLWAGAALGFGLVAAPLLFQEVPSRDLAGRIAGLVIGRLDWAAWAVFLLAGLSWAGRWMAELKEDLIGPMRLWGAALTVALLMCMSSSFVVGPKVHAIRERIAAPIETLAKDSPDRVAYNKAHGLSRNLFFIRVLLALGLAATVGFLPLKNED